MFFHNTYIVKNVIKFNVLLNYINKIQFYDTKLNLIINSQLKSIFVYMYMKFSVLFIKFYEV